MKNLKRISEIAKELDYSSMTLKRYLDKVNINPYRSAGGLFYLDDTQAKQLIDYLRPAQANPNEQSIAPKKSKNRKEK